MITVGQLVKAAIEQKQLKLTTVAGAAGFPGVFALELLMQDVGVLPIKLTLPLADALKVDPVTFYRTAMMQFRPKQWDELQMTLGGRPITPKNIKHVETLRQLGFKLDTLTAKDFERYQYALRQMNR